jgi:AraC-like DNA-binding protein
MIIQLDVDEGIGLMQMLAKSTGSVIKDGVLNLPESFGNGYIRSIKLGAMMSMIIHEYDLANDFTLAIPSCKSNSDFITFSFRNVFPVRSSENETGYIHKTNSNLFPSVQVTSGGINLEMSFTAKTKINTVIINIHVSLLKDLINKGDGHMLLQTIMSGGKPFLFEEIISPEIQNTAAKMLAEDVRIELQDFYYKLKAEELIYLFFRELLKRKNTVHYPANISDLKKIYEIRDKVIVDLTSPPNLNELAEFAAMSESKMNRLFKQIFGNTIYDYHQKLRVTEAARLIKNGDLSVSEAGYQLGFSNLSHFTRIFEKHVGLKPKRYSLK